MSNDQNNNKDANYWKIMNSAITLDIQKGHLKWTMTDLSRHADVQRTLIYYYFGKEKLDILIEACHLFGKVYAGTSDMQKGLYEKGDFTTGLRYAREVLRECPALAPFYFINRSKVNKVGEVIRHYHQQGIQRRYEMLGGTKKMAKPLFAMQFGLALFEDIEDSDIEEAASLIASFSNAKAQE